METVVGGDGRDAGAPASPLRQQRDGLHAGLNALQVAASAVTTAEPRFAFASLEAALRYLQDVLLPGCRAEESTIFVAVDGLMGVVNSCHAMKVQHTTIIRMAGDFAQALEAAKLEGNVEEYVKFLQPLLFGLYALCRAHIESEDDAYIGLLEAMLSEVQVAALAESFEAALESPEQTISTQE